ncbi:hypothetical protein H9651_08895 [Microbacterium sp. Sa4CUA7]|uniref:Phosphotriesterase n=2 Tax=Microbacterium pullorum TaxID=2762236 RepID=A0ABR8S313_9MICO|nr:hypothetical protein [Microbacterium pullorum]
MTSMHEHLNADMEILTRVAKQFGFPPPPAEMLTLENHNLAFLRSGAAIFSEASMTAGDIDFTAAELGFFRAVGGRSIVDPSPIGIRGDVTQLREASRQADVHVVCATGLYTAANRPDEYAGWTEEQQHELFLRDVTEGIDGSDVRAGILKCALSAVSADAPLDEVELATLRACARVSQETGVSVHVHSAFPMTGDHVLRGLSLLVDEMSLEPGRVVMMHMDSFLRPWDSRSRYIDSLDAVKSVDVTGVQRVLDRGVTVGFDSWGSNVDLLPQDDDRLKALLHLVRSGYDGQIVLGHDVTQKPQGVSYGGTGFTWFPALIPPVLAQAGVGEDAYRRMTTDNPARVLAH